jgi:hypothetical protein
MDASFDQWFAREILVHEAALVRYLARMWSNRRQQFPELRAQPADRRQQLRRTQPQAATITVLHDREHPSHITFTTYEDKELEKLQPKERR